MLNNLTWFQCIQYTKPIGMMARWQKLTCVTIMTGIVQMDIEPKLNFSSYLRQGISVD